MCLPQRAKGIVIGKVTLVWRDCSLFCVNPGAILFLPSLFALVYLSNRGLLIPYGVAVKTLLADHDDVIKWKHFPRYWLFVRGIHWSPVNSPHKGQWRGALMFSLICAWINGRVNNGEAGDLRRHRAHYDVTVMGNRLSPVRCWAVTWTNGDLLSIETLRANCCDIYLLQENVCKMTAILSRPYCVDSSPPSAAHLLCWTG